MSGGESVRTPSACAEPNCWGFGVCEGWEEDQSQWCWIPRVARVSDLCQRRASFTNQLQHPRPSRRGRDGNRCRARNIYSGIRFSLFFFIYAKCLANWQFQFESLLTTQRVQGFWTTRWQQSGIKFVVEFSWLNQRHPITDVLVISSSNVSGMVDSRRLSTVFPERRVQVAM